MATIQDRTCNAHDGASSRAPLRQGAARERFERHGARAEEPERSDPRVRDLAHDLGNMLCVISGYTDLALLQGDVPPQGRALLEAIKEASGRAAGLARRMRGLGEPAPGGGSRPAP